MEKMDDTNIPRKPVALICAVVKKEIVMAIRDVMRKYPLPLYMMHNILDSIASELKNEAYMELADETQTYIHNLQQYYIDGKEQLIKDFENKEG